MTLYIAMLYLHLLGALSLFMMFAVEWVVERPIRRCATLEQARPWLMAGSSARLLGALSGILIFIPGLWLAAHEQLWKEAWIQAAITVALVIAVIGMGVTRPRMGKLVKAAMVGGQSTADASRLLRDPVVFYSLRVRTGMSLGVLYLMAAKPQLTTTLLAIGAGLIFGILWAIAGGSKK